jgi:hypothetical protein
MFGLTEEHNAVIPECAIVDDYGITYIDKNYRDEGVANGWLIFQQHWFNEYGTMVKLYRPV